MVEPGGVTNDYAYNNIDKLTSVTNRMQTGNPIDDIVTKYGYDNAGSLTHVTDGEQNTTTYTYNPWGLPESTIEPATATHPNVADRTYTRTYDVRGLAAKDIAPGGYATQRDFDELQRVTIETATAPNGDTASRTFGWDLANNMVSASSDAGSTTFLFDDRGLLYNSTNNGNVSKFAYDQSGNLTRREDALGTTSFDYDNRNLLKTTVDPLSGQELTYSYSDTGQIESVTNGTTETERRYSYDDLARRSTDNIVDTTTGSIQSSTIYTYDPSGNIETEAVTAGANAALNLYSYDQSNRLTSWTRPDGGQTTYGWDKAANRTSADGVLYTYDERNRLTSSSAGESFAWSARGTQDSVTSNGATENSEFDAFGRLTATGDIEYDYDPLDRVTSRTDNTTGVESSDAFTYDGPTSDPVTIGDTSISRTPNGQPISTTTGETATAQLAITDIHGDLTATIHPITGEITTQAFDPFGNQTSANTSVYGFQSDFTDPETGNVWMGARFYNPATATFRSRDTYAGVSGRPSSLNRYSYAENNPIAGHDPTGNCKVAIQRLYDNEALNCETTWESIKRHGKKFVNQLIESGKAMVEAGKAMVRTGMACSSALNPGLENCLDHIRENRKLFAVVAFEVVLPLALAGLGLLCGPAAAVCSTAGMAVGTVVGKYLSAALDGDPNTDATSWQPLKEAAVDLAIEAALFGFGKLAKLRKLATIGRAGAKGGASAAKASLKTGFKQLDNGIRTGFSRIDNAARAGFKRLDNNLGRTAAKACSFSAATGVLLADGTFRDISKVKVGDIVVASDPETGETANREVAHVFVHEDTLFNLTMANGDTVTTTENHPFWNAIDQEFQSAGSLDRGDTILSANGNTLVVAGLDWDTGGNNIAYNLSVEDIHTYYVKVGDQEALVHNVCPDFGELDDLGRATGVTAELTKKDIMTGSRAWRNTPAGWVNGKINDRGHLLGKQLGGKGNDARNLVTLNKGPNQTTMRKFENEVRRALEGGEKVTYSVTPRYVGDDLIPVGVTLEAKGSGGFELFVSVLN